MPDPTTLNPAVGSSPSATPGSGAGSTSDFASAYAQSEGGPGASSTAGGPPSSGGSSTSAGATPTSPPVDASTPDGPLPWHKDPRFQEFNQNRNEYQQFKALFPSAEDANRLMAENQYFNDMWRSAFSTPGRFSEELYRINPTGFATLVNGFSDFVERMGLAAPESKPVPSQPLSGYDPSLADPQAQRLQTIEDKISAYERSREQERVEDERRRYQADEESRYQRGLQLEQRINQEMQAMNDRVRVPEFARESLANSVKFRLQSDRWGLQRLANGNFYDVGRIWQEEYQRLSPLWAKNGNSGPSMAAGTPQASGPMPTLPNTAGTPATLEEARARAKEIAIRMLGGKR